MNRPTPSPVPAIGDELCLKFLAGPGRFSLDGWMWGKGGGAKD